jgi:hypothetical protein
MSNCGILESSDFRKSIFRDRFLLGIFVFLHVLNDKMEHPIRFDRSNLAVIAATQVRDSATILLLKCMFLTKPVQYRYSEYRSYFGKSMV